MSLGGRAASIARRTALSSGKAALSAAAPPKAPAPAPTPVSGDSARPSFASGREQSIARRAQLSKNGKGGGTIEYSPKVVAVETHRGQSVTGLRIGPDAQVTGGSRGAAQPISGTQYIGPGSGAAWRAAGPKVGLARTERGLVVTGTLVRSKVQITGDEAGSGIAISGEADQRIDDDLTERSGGGYTPSAQFARQTDPHGASVFGSNVGRSARSFGSRERSERAAIESTENGAAITGSAVGRSVRVTGDEAGTCRRVTGDQYMTPARAQADCGGRLGGTAPAAHVGADRPDPVTGAKVVTGETHSGLRITGINVEHDPRVTGTAPGSCAAITGSAYQGAATARDWCAPAPERKAAPLPPAARPPQARNAEADRITGSFATGNGKVTGNLEFGFSPRRAEGAAPARLKVTGEGRSANGMTGSAWGEQSNVTGTEGATSASRNPTRRSGKPQAFSGAARFKALASHEEPKHLVTGMSGYSSDTSAKVTLSGGAQG